ncbi:PQQ-like beta-propeller repeat protein [Actinokineospora sp. UTMC 2448]|uniref:PQQ-like beta-propeller repeat protein n=1 Tax=Actinokineospora sp. UTMC 2448 TaxID=2268449 RepID=UPI002164DB65|nr:PQQ-like beta-propeller repeat protein [Actinokineospora sp. UTMC 2448]UVS80464.1 PQQ enzyme repeat [Actinokineospora sp. UTMC 2448]
MTYHDPRGRRPPQQYPAGPYGPYPLPGPQWTPPPPKRQTGIIIVSVVAAVVVIAAAAGVWLWTRGDGGGGTAGGDEHAAAVEAVGAAEVVWQVDQGLAPEAVGADDHWVTDEHLVRRLPGRVVAYELKTGETAWELPVGEVDDDRCPSSVGHSGLRVALLVATGDKSPQTCEKLTVVDIGAGREVFTVDLPPIERVPVRIDVPVVFGEHVVIPSRAGTRVLAIDDGAVRSTPKPDAACKSTKAALFGDLLLAQAECDNGKESDIRLRSFGADLKMVWEWVTPQGDDGEPLPVLGVLSLDPLVVELGHSGGDTRLMRVDPGSGRTVRIAEYTGGTRGDYMSACDGWAMGTCEMAKVVGDKVILTTVMVRVNPGDPRAAPGMEATDRRNELVAFDLGTGERAWRTGIEPGRTLSLVATADGSVAAYRPEDPNGGMGILYSVDPDTGALAPLMPIGPKAHEDDRLNTHVRSFAFRGDNQLAFLRDGLFVVFTGVHRASSVGDVDTVAFALP